MSSSLFAYMMDSSNTGVKLLAVLGGALVSGLLVGFLTGTMVKLLTKRQQPLPPLPRRVIRLGGAIIGGWIVAMFVFGPGGWGFGPGGGPGSGDGDDHGPGTTERGKPHPTPPPTLPPATDIKTRPPLRVEVLGPDPLRAIGGPTADLNRRYRVETPQGKRVLLNLTEVKVLISKAVEEDPPLRHIKVIWYRDSPADDKGWITNLIKWAEDLPASDNSKLKVEQDSRPKIDAPH
jgi:hypothetical protein